MKSCSRLVHPVVGVAPVTENWFLAALVVLRVMPDITQGLPSRQSQSADDPRHNQGAHLHQPFIKLLPYALNSAQPGSRRTSPDVCPPPVLLTSQRSQTQVDGPAAVVIDSMKCAGSFAQGLKGSTLKRGAAEVLLVGRVPASGMTADGCG
jgi:hypothetical protein